MSVFSLLVGLIWLLLSHWRLIAAVAILIGTIAFLFGDRVGVPVQWKHKEVLGKLRSYEVAQLSVVAFVFLLCGAVYSQAWSFVWLASAIPVLRCCSKELMAIFKAEGEFIPRIGEAMLLSKTICSSIVMVFMVWLAYAALAYTRDAIHPLEVYCFQFRGVDCSGSLAAWGGAGNCVILAESHGSCKSYCESYNRTCVKACDDVGTGACVPQHGASRRQTMEENGCLQDWRTQLCVCTGFADSRSWQDRLDESTASLPADAAWDAEPGIATDETSSPWSVEEPVRVPSWETEEAENCFIRNVEYVPLDMPGQGRTVTSSPEQCQRRCYRTMGCARFTWLPLSEFRFGRGACHLQEYRSTKQVAMGAIAGPSSCDDEQMAELLGHAPPPVRQRPPAKQPQAAAVAQEKPSRPTQPSRPAHEQPPRTKWPTSQTEPGIPVRGIPGEQPMLAVEESLQQVSGFAQAWYAQETHWEKPVIQEGNPVSLLWVFGLFMALAASGVLERRRQLQ